VGRIRKGFRRRAESRRISVAEGIRNHIRSNVIGYVALFVALSGTAYAVDGPLPGQNQVGSADIIDKEVQTNDIGTGQVKNPDLASNAVNSARIANGTVMPDDTGTVPAVRATSPVSDINGECLSGSKTGQPTTMVFQTEAFDTANMHSTPAGCAPDEAPLIAPRSGVYLLSAGLAWAQNATGTRYVGINRNGSPVAADERQANGGTGAGGTLLTVTTTTALNQGDELTVEVNQNTGGSLIIQGVDSRTYFAATWLGPAP
jgi:hypothetical protein